MKRIAVIGTGYVGLVSGTCFSHIGNSIICCDIDQQKINNLKRGIIPIYEPGLEELLKNNVEAGRLQFTTDIASAIQTADIIYIAVGTPMSITGEADLRYVTSVAQTIGANLNEYKVIVNKSTVPVGTGRLVERIIRENLQDKKLSFDVVSNPEFLKEGSAIADCMNMERAIIGATSDRAARLIEELHEPFNTNIFITDLESAEMIKYASNTFLATKISFINSIANICERVGADVTDVAAGMGLDSRIGSKFLQAGIGYGGSCFPKDTHAIVHIAESAGYEFRLMKSVIETNEKQRIVVIQKLKELVGELKGKTIGILGLAFKPNTDDMRDAPSISIIPKLLQQGAKIKAFDPIAAKEAKIHFGDKIIYEKTLYETVKDCDVCLILTEWEDIKRMNLDQVKLLLKEPIIVDGRNCFEPDLMREKGFTYSSIGRSNVYGEKQDGINSDKRLRKLGYSFEAGD
ncbi:UDP-glucose/GDP-mannose dehydrogenase family protein [Paenibacillus sp. 2TAB23]|uniref:UDP-glucose 6-dehydrogenase TuaD n=1 Tax=Paenibacillus sp. 2TAB23 TaxID=3233004 RepID=UPI003F97DA35